MVLSAIEERYSVRKFSEEMPSDEQINNILEAARLAPSFMNIQSWHFIVIKNKAMKSLLVKLTSGQRHIEQAPIVIACLADLNCFDFENYKVHQSRRFGMTEERLLSVMNSPVMNPALKGLNTIKTRGLEELTYAIAYMTLEAHNQGLGACIIGGIGNEYTDGNPEVYSVVKEELELPKNVYLGALLLVGYKSDDLEAPPKQRKSIQDIVSYEKYKNESNS